MELITYFFVLYLEHGRHDVKCKPSIIFVLRTGKPTLFDGAEYGKDGNVHNVQDSC